MEPIGSRKPGRGSCDIFGHRFVVAPVVLTGAMRPSSSTSDATQNITEGHSRCARGSRRLLRHARQGARFPGVIKDHELGTFIPAPG